MSLWDTVKDVASDVTSEAKSVADKAKVKNAIRAEEQKISKFYNEIGEKFYNSNEIAPAGYEEKFNGIKAAKDEIEKLKAELSKC